jgi:hypothetical protein
MPTTSELEQILWRIGEERKIAEPGTKHYLTLAMHNIEMAIETRRKLSEMAEARKVRSER